MKTIRTTLVVAAVLLLVACSKLTEDNLEKIHEGMTTTQVKAILGEPTHTETQGMLGINGTAFTYHTANSDVKIIFLNDKVVSKEGTF